MERGTEEVVFALEMSRSFGVWPGTRFWTNECSAASHREEFSSGVKR